MNEVIKEYIDTYVKENGNEEITGAILNTTLKKMVSELYAHRCYGVITPSLPMLYADDIPAWGVASQNGTYTNYGGIEVSDELALIVYDGGTFTKQTIISKSWINNIVNDLNNKLIGTATIKYNTTLDVVEIEYANGTTLQVGREQVSFVYNSTGATIPNGTPVYYSGVGGSGIQMPTIAAGDASNLATAMIKGHTTIDIPNESYGIIVCKGEMTVESHGLTVGSKIYLGVGGGYVTTPPSNPNLTIELGIVLDANTLHVYPCIISPFVNSSTSLTSQLFLSNADSGISTFKNLSKVLDVAETTKTITATNNTVAGEKYISEQLGITSIPAAVFLAHSTCKVSSTLGTSTIKFDVSLYHEDTTTTLLFSDESEDINFTTDTVIEFSVPFTAITCLATDRLLIELYFTATHTTPVTLTYYVGDGRATYITLPLPISHTDLSNLNSDPNFQHVTGSQITSWNNKLDSVSIPLSNMLFSDSINGNDTTGDGTIIKPFKTLTKVVDFYTYQTILGYVTSGSPNVTGVSDVDIAKVKIGDKVKFSGMTTYGHTVISITLSSGNNTIVTNTNFAVSSGVELSVYTEKMVKAFGTFNIDASIEKDGLFWDFSGAICIIGNATAFSITSAKNSDFVVKGGKWLGVHANSKLLLENATDSNSSIYINYESAKSIGTGRWIEVVSGNNVYIENKKTLTNGSNYFIACSNLYLKTLDSEGLLENYISAGGEVLGKFKTPASVRVLNLACDYKKLIVSGKLDGKIYSTGNSQQITFDCDFTSTNIDLGGFHAQHIINGALRSGATITMLSDRTDVILNAASLYETTITVNQANSTFVINGKGVYTITCTNGLLEINHSNNVGAGGNDYYVLNVNGGVAIINGKKIGKGTLTRDFQISSGELYIRADVSVTNPYSPIVEQTGGKVYVQNATITHTNNVDNTRPMFQKSAGDLIFENAKLKTNGTYKQSFVKCTANTSASKDIYVFGHCKTDADGTTYGLLLPFDGSSYTPNAVILEQLTESTSLTNIL